MAETVTDRSLSDSELDARLHVTWTARGAWAWLSTVDHKVVGKRFIITAFVFMVLGGALALAMRLQLAQPEARLIDPDVYRQLMSMHGTTMMFLFAVPVMEAFAIYLVPLMVGTRNIAFPRLNAFSYWVYLSGGTMIWIAFFLNAAPEAGWFSYVPLAGPEFSPGKRIDFWAQMITFTEVSALAAAVEVIVTTFKLRAPGMTLDRIPLFVWAMLVTAFATLLAMPAVMMASSMLIMDRLIDTHFFNPVEGGDVLLWQHLFWFFGHPEVYIIFLPAAGMVSTIIATFCRRPMVGYLPIVISLIATGFLAFGLWVHHMFATGLPQLGESFFTASSMMIAIPSGVQVFCWLATLWTGHPQFKPPLLFALGFLATFVMGGLTGVMVASVPVDLQVHDTYFLIAHFHYVLVGGAVFPLLGATIYWFPKFTGRMMDERLARASFWLSFVGMNVTFFPMHILGLEGMPRRVWTYKVDTGWGDLNLLSTVGGAILVSGLGLFFINIIHSRRNGTVAGPNPWGASTLEWACPSPPPPYNFLRIPYVTGRDPLWENPDELPVVSGLAVDKREQIVSSLTEARAQVRESSPHPTAWPFAAAMVGGAGAIASVFTPWAVLWGAAPLAIGLIGWFWPKNTPEDEE